MGGCDGGGPEGLWSASVAARSITIAPTSAMRAGGSAVRRAGEQPILPVRCLDLQRPCSAAELAARLDPRKLQSLPLNVPPAEAAPGPEPSLTEHARRPAATTPTRQIPAAGDINRTRSHSSLRLAMILTSSDVPRAALRAGEPVLRRSARSSGP